MPFNCREIAISLTDPDFGEQTAQACANAWFRKLSRTRVRDGLWITSELPVIQGQSREALGLEGTARFSGLSAQKAFAYDQITERSILPIFVLPVNTIAI
jgi:hypothetical protein